MITDTRNILNIKQRIQRLVAAALAAQTTMEKGNHVNIDNWFKAQGELEKELNAIDKAAGEGLAVGRVISFGVGDGVACYIVTKIRKNDVIVEWVPLCDGYSSPAVWLTADKRNYMIQRDVAERQCRFTLPAPMKLVGA
jgi:hypothetical protein